MDKDYTLVPADVLNNVIKLLVSQKDSEEIYQKERQRLIKQDEIEDEVDDEKTVPESFDELRTIFLKFKTFPKLASYNLQDNDVLVIALMWKEYINNSRRGLTWDDICKKARMNVSDTNKCHDYIRSLVKRKIVYLDSVSQNAKYNVTCFDIFDNDLRLRKDFVAKLLGYDLISEMAKTMCESWCNNSELIDDLKQFIPSILKCFSNEKRYYHVESDSFDTDILLDALNVFREKINNSDEKIILRRVIDDYKLTDAEINILILVTCYSLDRDSIEVGELLSFVSRNCQEYRANKQYLENSSKLIKNELLSLENKSQFDKAGAVELSKNFKRRLLGEVSWVSEKHNDEEIRCLISDSDCFYIQNTAQRISDLILPAEEKSTLRDFIRKQSDPDRYSLRNWGFEKDSGQTAERHRGLIALFYGVSGTGKTYAAGAIANELNRSLVAFDCSKLRSHFYGSSEKNVSQAFSRMNQIASEAKNPPVFLLNEADQIIYKRRQSLSNTEITDNSIQNIILEKLESFSGILILTTNLVELIDEAYFRRFNLRQEFKTPDLECRKKLWELHLNKEIPGSEEIDIELLAKNYNLTGGEIFNIVQNACSVAIIRTGEERKLRMEDLIRFAKLEKPWQRATTSNRIGYDFNSLTIRTG